jgi:hypothetical protein
MVISFDLGPVVGRPFWVNFFPQAFPGLKARLRKATRLSSPKSYVAAGQSAEAALRCRRAVA